jgi:hypothetical protein
VCSSQIKLCSGRPSRLGRSLSKASRTSSRVRTRLPNGYDFHSTRRAYATALVRAGASDRETMKLDGWSTSALITRYSEKDAVRSLPAAAVPVLVPATVPALPPQSESCPAAEPRIETELFCGAPGTPDVQGFYRCRRPAEHGCTPRYKPGAGTPREGIGLARLRRSEGDD